MGSSSSKRSWSLSLLPPEIIQEIFYRTPAEALVLAKPTCKKWYALLTDERFIYQHLRRSQERFIRIFDDTVQIIDPVTRARSVSPIQNEFQPPYDEIVTMVHCDGLMLCKVRDLIQLRSANLALWNPLTRKIRWVEPADVITGSDYYGIGYSNSKKNKAREDGYKIVKFTYVPEGFENVVPEVEIYEFNTSSWRTVGCKVDADVEITRKCVAVMGNMYWAAYRVETPDEEFIRVFDFSDETFKDVCLCPPSYGDNSQLSCFNGDRLSILQQDEASKQIEVWVSSKLGDGYVSFSKCFSLSGLGLPALRVNLDAARPVYCFVKPKGVIVWCVGVEGKGDKVRNCLTLYEIDNVGVRDKRVTEVNYLRDYSRSFLCGYVYIPSLVPLP